jgi:carboxypeptidase C (cathepsin A)
MKHILPTALFSLSLLQLSPMAAPAWADQPTAAEETAMLPPEASVSLTVTLDGRVMKYRASAGAVPVFDATGKRAGDVAYTSYVLEGQSASKRPVTFFFGGGPGASSTGALDNGLGPKRLQNGVQGDTPSDSIERKDNPATWLGFTDMVFVDPIGTGFSRSYLPPEATAKEFYGVDQDVRYLSGVVFDWLIAKERMPSPKYIVGESYGAVRTPKIVEELGLWRGVGVNGVVLISTLFQNLKGPIGDAIESLSPMSWSIDLPSMTAANFERQGKTLTPETLQEIEEYSRGEYLTALTKGWSDPAAFDAMIRRVAGYTGLDEAKVREFGGRLDPFTFVREFARSTGKAGSRYDINWMTVDPFPWSFEVQSQDAILTTFVADGAAADYMTRVIGWKVKGRYWPFNPDVYPKWAGRDSLESLSATRRIMALNPKLKVLVVNGYTDLSTPFMLSKLAVDQMPPQLRGERIFLKIYPGGHIFYDRMGSAMAFKNDVAHLYQ